MTSPLVGAFFGGMNRINAAHPWSHNRFHSRWVLAQARRVRAAGGRRAVEVGCGTGHLVVRLARVLPDVVGVEPDAEAAARARRRTVGTPGVRIIESGFGVELGDPVDLVVFVAVLHHLPLRETLRRVRGTLAPGGRLVVVGLAQDDSGPALDLLSLILNPIIGVLRNPRARRGRPESMTAPAAEAREGRAEIRAALSDELPGARFRPSVFWRYRALWVAPRRPTDLETERYGHRSIVAGSTGRSVERKRRPAGSPVLGSAFMRT